MEMWDLFDQHEKPLGVTHPRGTPLPPDTFHLIAHIWVKNAKGEFLIQKRAATVEVYPNFWATTGGSILAGERSLDGAKRELAEEVGLHLPCDSFNFLFSYQRKNRFAHVYLCHSEIEISQLTLDPHEVASAKWMTIGHIRSLLAQGKMFDYGETYLEKLINHPKT
jgi:8-oxo-dGTP diphosphatase